MVREFHLRESCNQGMGAASLSTIINELHAFCKLNQSWKDRLIVDIPFPTPLLLVANSIAMMAKKSHGESVKLELHIVQFYEVTHAIKKRKICGYLILRLCSVTGKLKLNVVFSLFI
jgi:hypothetical protein